MAKGDGWIERRHIQKEYDDDYSPTESFGCRQLAKKI
jgi:hypothetical protein